MCHCQQNTMRRVKIITDRTSMSRVEELNLTEATKQTRLIFSLLGVWPMMTKNITIIEKHLSMIVHILCQSLLAFVIFPSFFHLFWREKNFKMKIALFGPVGVAVGCALKYIAIIYRRREIKRCIEQMEKDWDEIQSERDHEIMMKNVKMAKIMTTLFAIFMYTGGVSHQILAPFLPGSIISIVDNSTKRPLIYPVYDTMFDTQVTPVYEMTYLSHVLMGVVVCSMTTGTCNLGAIFVTHLLSQNQIMASRLEELTDIENKKKNNTNEQMSTIIELHNKIIRFSADIEQVLREICMIAILETIYFICMAEYYSITAWRNNETFGAIIYCILVEAFTFNCFIFCHIGELSKEQFQKSGEAVYMTEWYRLSRGNAKSMVLIIALTQHPPKITAGGLMELSYNGFVSVIKTSVAYFNIMRMVEF